MNLIQATIRETKTKGQVNTLRKKGEVPGIVYGKGSEPTKIAFENKELQKLMHSGSFYS